MYVEFAYLDGNDRNSTVFRWSEIQRLARISGSEGQNPFLRFQTILHVFQLLCPTAEDDLLSVKGALHETAVALKLLANEGDDT